MKWEEIRKLYPNQWVKLKILGSHIEGSKQIIDEMEYIKTISTNSEAGRELGKCTDTECVYHTYHEEIYYKIKNIFGFRVAR